MLEFYDYSYNTAHEYLSLPNDNCTKKKKKLQDSFIKVVGDCSNLR
jgi:hypothetical protein